MMTLSLVPQAVFIVVDSFEISNIGTVVTGTVQDGIIIPNEELVLVTPASKHMIVHCTGIEQIMDGKRARIESAEKGEAAGLFLSGIHKDEIPVGSLLCRWKFTYNQKED